MLRGVSFLWLELGSDHSWFFRWQCSLIRSKKWPKAKLLASEYLLQKTFDLKPSKSLLSHRPSWCESDSAHLTAVELAVDAVKLLWQLWDREWQLECQFYSADTAGSCPVCCASAMGAGYVIGC